MLALRGASMYDVQKVECNDGKMRWIIVGLHVAYPDIPCIQAGMFERKEDAMKMACAYSAVPWKERKAWRKEVARIKALQRK